MCMFIYAGGEGGIRTHGRLPYTRFPSVLFKPLRHLSLLLDILVMDRIWILYVEDMVKGYYLRREIYLL